VLALIGAAAGPSWSPQPLTDPIDIASPSTAIGGLDAARAEGLPLYPIGSFAVRSTDVTIGLNGETVRGILREPIGAGDNLPGMSFVHGAGTGLATEAFIAQGEAFASAGIVTLVPDKRLDTYSTWNRDYVTEAGDYLRSVDFLRDVDSVNPASVGVYGESEGTWIVPVMQVKDPKILWTVLVSAPVVPPRQQAAFAVDNYLRAIGVPGQVFRAIPRAVGMQLPGTLLDYADYNVTGWMQRQTAPILVVYGTADQSMPIIQGAQTIIADAATTGSQAPVTVRYYGGADHGIRLDASSDQARDAGGDVDARFLADVAAWVNGMPHTAGAAPQVAGAHPRQDFLASPVPQPRWWGNGDIVVGSVTAGLVLLVLGPLVWCAASMLRRVTSVGRGLLTVGVHSRLGAPIIAAKQWHMTSQYKPLLLSLGLCSVLTAVGLIVYLMAVATLAFGLEHNTLVISGGWLGVRVLGIITVVIGARLIERARAVRAARARGTSDDVVLSGWPAYLTLTTTLVGSLVLLLWLAYWGVFQLGI
jgi:dienelactone hydrolase